MNSRTPAAPTLMSDWYDPCVRAWEGVVCSISGGTRGWPSVQTQECKRWDFFSRSSLIVAWMRSGVVGRAGSGLEECVCVCVWFLNPSRLPARMYAWCSATLCRTDPERDQTVGIICQCHSCSSLEDIIKHSFQEPLTCVTKDASSVYLFLCT